MSAPPIGFSEPPSLLPTPRQRKNGKIEPQPGHPNPSRRLRSLSPSAAPISRTFHHLPPIGEVRVKTWRPIPYENVGSAGSRWAAPKDPDCRGLPRPYRGSSQFTLHRFTWASMHELSEWFDDPPDT